MNSHLGQSGAIRCIKGDKSLSDYSRRKVMEETEEYRSPNIDFDIFIPE
jgi:hypothetical protein